MFSELDINQTLVDKDAFDRAWFQLVEEIVDLDEQLSQELASSDKDALSSIAHLTQELERKRRLLKRLDLGEYDPTMKL